MTGKIYFASAGLSGHGSGSIRVVDRDDGANEKVLVSGEYVDEPDTLEIDAARGKIYWTNMGRGASLDRSAAPNSGSICRANLDGSGVEILVPVGVTSTPKQIALDVQGGKMYWSDRGDVGDQCVNPKIMRANLEDGASVETLISSDLLSPVGMALDVSNGKLYFTDRYANNIKRANLDGTDVESVVVDTKYPVDLSIDHDKREIYWTARNDGAVFKASMMNDGINVNGSLLKPIITGLTAPIGVAVDTVNQKVLYTEVSDKSGALWEANLGDGSDARKISTEVMPLGICFVPN